MLPFTSLSPAFRRILAKPHQDNFHYLVKQYCPYGKITNLCPHFCSYDCESPIISNLFWWLLNAHIFARVPYLTDFSSWDKLITCKLHLSRHLYEDGRLLVMLTSYWRIDWLDLFEVEYCFATIVWNDRVPWYGKE